MGSQSLRVAFARADVTPNRPCRMGGYNRKKLSEGVLDPIEVNVVAAEVGGVPFVLAVLDSIMVSEEFARRLQARVAEACAVPCANIVACAIHSSSPLRRPRRRGG